MRLCYGKIRVVRPSCGHIFLMIHDILAFLAEENRRNQAGEAPQVTAESLKLITDVLGLDVQSEARLGHKVEEDEGKPQRRKLAHNCGGASSYESTSTCDPMIVPAIESKNS